MTANLINTAILALAFLTLFATAEFLYHRLKWKAEVTRKIVHVFTGIFTLLFPPMIENHWLVLALCGSFLLILLVSFPLNLLPSINAVRRKTNGSVIYPIIVYACYLIYQHYDDLSLYYIPILTLALCDPIAALVGKKIPFGTYVTFGHEKTLSGSTAFFLAAFILSLVLLINMTTISLPLVLLIAGSLALGTAIAEAFSHGGYDNFTIPATAMGILLIYQSFLPYGAL